MADLFQDFSGKRILCVPWKVIQDKREVNRIGDGVEVFDDPRGRYVCIVIRSYGRDGVGTVVSGKTGFCDVIVKCDRAGVIDDAMVEVFAGKIEQGISLLFCERKKLSCCSVDHNACYAGVFQEVKVFDECRFVNRISGIERCRYRCNKSGQVDVDDVVFHLQVSTPRSLCCKVRYVSDLHVIGTIDKNFPN